jgi:hypothetical protein
LGMIAVFVDHSPNWSKSKSKSKSLAFDRAMREQCENNATHSERETLIAHLSSLISHLSSLISHLRTVIRQGSYCAGVLGMEQGDDFSWNFHG